jgi:YidC/Oxa1 family membrane protein insertase
MTAKMMNVMTIVMGVMFWHVPAGLCIYFIASSLWGIAERKLLGSNVTADLPQVVVKDPAKKPGDNSASDGEVPAKPGFLGKLMAKLEEAQKQAEEAQRHAGHTRDKNSKGRNRKKGR